MGDPGARNFFCAVGAFEYSKISLSIRTPCKGGAPEKNNFDFKKFLIN